MAGKKKNPTVEAPVFKQTPNTNCEMDVKNEVKFSKIISRELKYFHSTPDPNHKLLNLKENIGQPLKPSRMLVYEDSSEEDETVRNTPPNIPDRNKLMTPGAPIKSRKEFEKKVLRPKKLVYNDKENDHKQEDLSKESYRFYHSTPKKSNKKEEDDDLYYEKFVDMTAIIPRKIIPIRDEDSGSVYSTNRQSSVASTSSKSIQQGRSYSRNQGSKKKNVDNETRRDMDKSAVLKNDLTCNKENNAVQLGTEKDLETRGLSSDSYKKRSIKNDRNREEFNNVSKIGELTHFRI